MNPVQQSLTSVNRREPVFFISKKPQRAVFIRNNTISLQCFFLSVSFITMYVLFLLHYMFSTLFLLQSHAIIQFPISFFHYDIRVVFITYSFLFLLLCICCRFCCKKFCVFSIFAQILQMKNEFVVIDGS